MNRLAKTVVYGLAGLALLVGQAQAANKPRSANNQTTPNRGFSRPGPSGHRSLSTPRHTKSTHQRHHVPARPHALAKSKASGKPSDKNGHRHDGPKTVAVAPNVLLPATVPATLVQPIQLLPAGFGVMPVLAPDVPTPNPDGASPANGGGRGAHAPGRVAKAEDEEEEDDAAESKPSKTNADGKTGSGSSHKANAGASKDRVADDHPSSRK